MSPSLSLPFIFSFFPFLSLLLLVPLYTLINFDDSLADDGEYTSKRWTLESDDRIHSERRKRTSRDLINLLEQERSILSLNKMMCVSGVHKRNECFTFAVAKYGAAVTD